MKAVILLVASILVFTIGAPTQSSFISENEELSINPGGVFVNGDLHSTGRITTDEYLQINGVSTEGQSCSSEGLIGRNEKGGILVCSNGGWVSTCTTPKSKRVIRMNSSNKVDYFVDLRIYCESHEQAVGGGGSCYNSPNSAIIVSTPWGDDWNGWRIGCTFPQSRLGQKSDVYVICQS